MKITEARHDAHLAKLLRSPDGTVQSLREYVEARVATGQARLTYRHGTRKIDGTVRPTRPVWTLWVEDSGVDVSKIAAEYAASLMSPPPSIQELEDQGEEAYRKALRELGGSIC